MIQIETAALQAYFYCLVTSNMLVILALFHVFLLQIYKEEYTDH